MHLFFDQYLEREFDNIYQKFKRIEKESSSEYEADIDTLKRKLVTFDPLPTVCNKEDFNVAAIDGSGAETLISLNDMSIHLFTASFAADKTKFQQGTTEQLQPHLPICTFPEGVLKLVLLREDKTDEVWKDFLDFILYNYGDSLGNIVRRVLYDLIGIKYRIVQRTISVPPANSDEELFQLAAQAKFKLRSKNLDKFSTWMVSPNPNQSRGWFEQFREVLEYSLAHALLQSDIKFKYIFLDGSMNMLMSPGQDQPRLAPNYLLRDLAIKSLKKGTCLTAVSKTTSFPFAYRIAQDLEKELGKERKWFVRIPTGGQNEQRLNILANRPHIPPMYGISYLYHFSSDVPLLRIDFDSTWWKKNIQGKTSKETKEKEIELFQDIDWLAREVRYFGYFFDLAFAHDSTIIRFPDRDKIAEMLIDYFVEKGEDYQTFIHPRRRLGLM
ncbi:MAG: hypothetical protein ACTSYD_10410 [Candidatus Heimdallarchaeaceae archaeon]